MIKPISNFDAYFLTSGDGKKLYGIDIQGVKKIDVIDQDGDEVVINDFFTSGGSLYFAVGEVESIEVDGQAINETNENYYKQTSNTITKIDKLPEKPKQSRISFDSSEFTIKEIAYENNPYTDVKNIVVTSGIERMKMVNNFLHFSGQGLYFCVSDGRYNEVVRVREAGLYFWDVTKSGCEYLLNEGVMWK